LSEFEDGCRSCPAWQARQIGGANRFLIFAARELGDLLCDRLAILDVVDVEAYERELAEEERDLKAIARLKKQILGK
jgi:hypothetical protein